MKITHVQQSLWKRHRRFSLGLSVGCLCFAKESLANTGINAEGVSDYSYARSSGEYPFAPDIQGAAEASGFYSGMMTSGSGWTAGSFFTNLGVFDTDFLDPDVAGGFTGDNDTNNFDTSTAAIGFFSGHGTCDDSTQNACTTTSQCGAGF